MMKILFGTFVLLIFASSASANGGPVQWSERNPLGGIVPLQMDSIILQQESIDIQVDELAREYHLQTRYVLLSHEKTEKLLYGIPFSQAIGAPPVERQSWQVELVFNQQTKKCNWIQGIGKYSESIKKRYQFAENVVWCLVELQFEYKKQNELLLKYKGVFEYTDRPRYSQYPFPSYGERKFEYLLFPAKQWGGKVHEFVVNIRLGKFINTLENVVPKGFRIDNETLHWSLHNVDFAKLDRIAFSLDVDSLLGFNERTRWHPKKDSYFSWAKVKTQGAFDGLSETESFNNTQKLLDQDPSTAWCASGPFGGVGQWFQYQLDHRAMPVGCWFVGFMVNPGDTKDQASYLASARPTEIRIGECEIQANKSSILENYRLKLQAQYSQSVQIIPHKQIPKDGCIRVDIHELEPGTQNDQVCLSGFVPLYNCDI
ncbi:MAG: hypothetical protein OEY38_11745 [Gammaproteobacteria bacterium]|nr:hypothetical protein [Gammaproteobacteria bacterium]